jgi:hypothetical protein
LPVSPRRTAEVPFVIGRVLLQDFTGVRCSSIWRRFARRGLDLERVQRSVHAVFVRAAAHAAAKVAETN